MSLYSHFGEIEYYAAELPKDGWDWCYSASGLQHILECEISGQRIKGIFVELNGYLSALELFGLRSNSINLTYMGCRCLTILNKTTVEFVVHGEGMFEYRLYRSSDAKLEKRRSFAPADVGLRGRDYFFDVLNAELSYTYVGETVNAVKAVGTTDWLFSMRGFDEARANDAGKNNDLPESIQLVTKACTICFIGDGFEYGWLKLKPTVQK
ncbi:MAG: hypothetical protein IKP19_05700 [Oscillospiraceae bacterium]|nr:hypothetical protein [Oscillospiraceae bacterium]